MHKHMYKMWLYNDTCRYTIYMHVQRGRPGPPQGLTPTHMSSTAACISGCRGEEGGGGGGW